MTAFVLKKARLDLAENFVKVLLRFEILLQIVFYLIGNLLVPWVSFGEEVHTFLAVTCVLLLFQFGFLRMICDTFFLFKPFSLLKFQFRMAILGFL